MTEPATSRQCGTCTLCCKVMGIGALDKPKGQWCPHCAPGKGCRIYDDRPTECRTFMCGWLSDPTLGPEWKPEKSKIVLAREEGRLVAHVDPDVPAAWKKSPFFEHLTRLVPIGLRQGRATYVAVGNRYILLLPDREEEIGLLGPDDEVLISAVPKSGGVEYRVTVKRPNPA